MRIQTLGAALTNVKFASFVPTKEEDMKQKEFKGEVSKAPDGSGNPVYKTTFSVLLFDDEGNLLREEKNASLTLLERCNVDAGVMYCVDGRVWVNHFTLEGSNQIRVGITADRVKPESEVKPIPFKELADKVNAPKIQMNPKA